MRAPSLSLSLWILSRDLSITLRASTDDSGVVSARGYLINLYLITLKIIMAKIIYMNYGPIPIYERTMGSGKLLFGYLLIALNISFCFFFKFVRGIIIAIYK
jgi:hypothetical protein